jgi:hypothetical protein
MQGSLHNVSIKVNGNEILRLHRLIRLTTRLDDDEASLTRNPAGIPKGIKNKAAANQFKIGFEDFLAEGF